MKKMLVSCLAALLTIPVFAAEKKQEHHPVETPVTQQNKKEPYTFVHFEMRAMYDEEGQSYLYPASLLALRERGYQRHPNPSEEFSLYFAGLEGKLNGEELAVFKNMQKTPAEWFNVTMQQDGDTLYCYEDLHYVQKADEPRMDLRGNLAEWYVEGIFQYTAMRTFTVIAPRGEYIPTEKISSDLVVYLFSRPTQAFPQAVKEEHMPEIMLPKDGQLWPMARSMNSCILGAYGFRSEASRGVLQKKK